MAVYKTALGMQYQSEIYLDGVLEKTGTTYDRFADFCLEPQC